MGRKNTFKPSALRLSTHFDGVVNGEKIVWYDDTSEDEDEEAEIREDLVTMEEYFSKLLNNPVSQYLLQNDKFKLSTFKDHILVGICEIKTYIKLYIEGDDRNYLYLITDPEFRDMYVAVGVSYPIFWYKYSTRKEFCEMFDRLHEAYNPDDYKIKFNKITRGFVGTKKMLDYSLDDIENQFISNVYAEPITWGSKWVDHPFREVYMDKMVTQREHIIFSGQSMKQKSYSNVSISVRSTFSRSIITVEDHDGAFVMDIQYEPIKSPQIRYVNDELAREFPEDVPVDVLMVISNLPFVTHTGLLEITPLSNYNFIMTSLVANCKEMYEELCVKIKKLMKEYENSKDEEDEETLELCTLFLKNLEANLKLDEIFAKEDIEAYLDDRLRLMRIDRVPTNQMYDQLKKDLEDKLEEFEYKDEELKSYVYSIMYNLLKLNK